MRVCGLDEVGRGALAGPLVAVGVILNVKCKIYNLQLRDSKKLSARQRNRLYKEIVDSGALVHVEMISVRLINSKGIGWANKEIFRKLIKKIDAERYIVDGNLKIKVSGKTKLINSLVKADSSVAEVMAASIVAKVLRDQHMIGIHDKHKIYGWSSNKGYGTRYHVQAIKQNGATAHHRKLFVRTALATFLTSPSPARLFTGFVADED